MGSTLSKFGFIFYFLEDDLPLCTFSEVEARK